MSLIIATLLLAEVATTTSSGPIIIEVTNVRNSQGRVHVGICPKDKFLADSCPYEGSAPARAGTTLVTVTGVPPGEYGAQSFHDENGNKNLDRALFGLPKEGVGFSRDAKIRMSPPKWAEAVFTHGAQTQNIHFALRYFLGPSGPEQWAKAHPGK